MNRLSPTWRTRFVTGTSSNIRLMGQFNMPFCLRTCPSDSIYIKCIFITYTFAFYTIVLSMCRWHTRRARSKATAGWTWYDAIERQCIRKCPSIDSICVFRRDPICHRGKMMFCAMIVNGWTVVTFHLIVEYTAMKRKTLLPCDRHAHRSREKNCQFHRKNLFATHAPLRHCIIGWLLIGKLLKVL